MADSVVSHDGAAKMGAANRAHEARPGFWRDWRDWSGEEKLAVAVLAVTMAIILPLCLVAAGQLFRL